MPVIPDTQDTEAGESVEFWRQKLQWARIAPLHSSLGDEQNSVSKKEKEKSTWIEKWMEHKINETINVWTLTYKYMKAEPFQYLNKMQTMK